MSDQASNIITFKWLSSLSGKRIRIGEIEGEFNGGQVTCASRGRIKIRINDINITLSGRDKSQIVIID